jgi:hypothetical protein
MSFEHRSSIIEQLDNHGIPIGCFTIRDHNIRKDYVKFPYLMFGGEVVVSTHERFFSGFLDYNILPPDEFIEKVVEINGGLIGSIKDKQIKKRNFGSVILKFE